MKFFIATKNGNKIKEFSRIFSDMGIEFVCENDFDSVMPEPEENGMTFSENALIKARAGLQFSGLPAIADDSGLCVDALGGKPDIFSARYAGPNCDSDENNKKLLHELKNVPLNRRTAYFICVIACVFPDGREFTVEGRCDGLIDISPSGKGGFGYDPLFISELGKFSEITPEQKDKVSHRGKAIKLFKERLNEYI